MPAWRLARKPCAFAGDGNVAIRPEPACCWCLLGPAQYRRLSMPAITAVLSSGCGFLRSPLRRLAPVLLVRDLSTGTRPRGGVCDGSNVQRGANALSAICRRRRLLQSGPNHGSGRLFADDGSKLTALSGGWQHVWAPWSSFTTQSLLRAGRTRRKVDSQNSGAARVMGRTRQVRADLQFPFDFCVYELSFLPKSDRSRAGRGCRGWRRNGNLLHRSRDGSAH